MIKFIKEKLFHPYDRRPLYKRLLGYCGCPCHKRKWFIYPSTIRMDTRYENEASNWITVCEDFYVDEIEPQIQEMWDDYWSSQFQLTNDKLYDKINVI